MTLQKIRGPALDHQPAGDVRGPYGFGRPAHGAPPDATYVPMTGARVERGPNEEAAVANLPEGSPGVAPGPSRATE
jgi:hypothetical protein